MVKSSQLKTNFIFLLNIKKNFCSKSFAEGEMLGQHHLTVEIDNFPIFKGLQKNICDFLPLSINISKIWFQIRIKHTWIGVWPYLRFFWLKTVLKLFSFLTFFFKVNDLEYRFWLHCWYGAVLKCWLGLRT